MAHGSDGGQWAVGGAPQWCAGTCRRMPSVPSGCHLVRPCRVGGPGSTQLLHQHPLLLCSFPRQGRAALHGGMGLSWEAAACETVRAALGKAAVGAASPRGGRQGSRGRRWENTGVGGGEPSARESALHGGL